MNYDYNNDPYGGYEYYDGSEMGQDQDAFVHGEGGDIYAGTSINISQSQSQGLHLSDISQGDAYSCGDYDTIANSQVSGLSQGSKRSIMVCHNCGGTDFQNSEDHVTGSDAEGVNLICSTCFTQVQAEIGASQTDEDAVMKLAARSGGRFKRQKTGVKDRDSKIIHLGEPLPSTEACLKAFQEMLIVYAKAAAKVCKASCSKDVNDIGSNENFEILLAETMGKFWFGFLKQWFTAANYYKSLYPDCRLSIRDSFLPRTVRALIRKRLSEQLPFNIKLAEKESLKEEQNENNSIVSKQEETNRAKSEGGYEDVNGVKNTKVKNLSVTIYAVEDLIHLLRLEEEASKRTKSPITPNEAAIRITPSPLLVVTCLYRAILHLRLGITAGMVCEWCADGRIPYIDSYYPLSNDTKLKLKGIRSFFLPKFLPQAAFLEYQAELLRIAASNYIPTLSSISLNVPVVIARFVCDAGLNQNVLQYSLSLMGFRQCTNCDGASKLPRPLQKDVLESFSNETLRIAAVIAVACRLIVGWESWNYGFRSTLSRESDAHFFPYNLEFLKFLRNGKSLQQYLDFVNKFFVKWYQESESPDSHSGYFNERNKKNEILKEHTNWLAFGTSESSVTEASIAEDPVTSTEADRLQSDTNLCIAQNDTIEESESRNLYEKVNAIGKFVVYRGSSHCLARSRGAEKMCSYFSPKAFHSHYSLLIEFLADRFGFEAHDLHCAVSKLDKSILEATKASI